VCAAGRDFTVIQLSKHTLVFHLSFSSAIKPPCVSNQQPNKLPGSLLRVCVFGRIKGTDIHTEN